ncbi:hypothetical protein DFS33DRAFT_1274294 [Desarmillaria ectypa]|nr:hypothetical protein DFS33DRAFT_1274294 [Desarmillaria ectypa]
MSFAWDNAHPSAPPAFQDKLLGRVASRWIMLYMLEIIQASNLCTSCTLYTKLIPALRQVIYFFNHYRRDRPLIKAGIIICLVTDTVCTISDESYVFDQYWYRHNDCRGTILSDISLLELNAPMDNFWDTWAWNVNIGYHVACIISVSPQAAGLVATAAAQIMYPQYAERYKGRVYVTVWLIASAVCDVCIAVSLSFQLRRMNPTFQESKRVINRLIGSVISTGTVSTIVAIVILIVFLKMPMTNVSTGVAFCLGRLYSLTMLYSLNKRNALRAEGSSGHSSGRQDRAVNFNAELFSTVGIHVHRTARIDISEAGREREPSSSHSAVSGVPATKASYADTEAYPLHNLDTGVNKTGMADYRSGWAV